MSFKIPTPIGLPPGIDAAFDELIAPLQARTDVRWQYLTGTDLVGVRGDSGVTFTVPLNFTNSATRGHLKYLRIDRFVLVSFNLGLTPSAVTAHISLVIPQFAVVGRSAGVGVDTNNNVLTLSLGTPLEVLDNSTLSATLSVLQLRKLDGTNFAASAQGVRGQLMAELSEVELG